VTVLNLLTLSTAIFGFIVSGILIFSIKHNRFVNRFLGIGFFSLSYRTLSIYLLNERLIPDTFIMGSVSFVYYWALPALYIYIRTLILDEQSLKKNDRLHFVLPGLATILAMIYLAGGWISTGQVSLPAQPAPGNLAFTWPIPVIWHALLLFCMGVFYTVMSWRVVYRRFFKVKPVHPQAQKIRNWVLLLLIPFTLLLLILFFGPILSLFTTINTYFSSMGIRSLLLIFIFSRVLLNSDLLFGLPDIETRLPFIYFLKQSAGADPVVVTSEQGRDAAPEPNKIEEAPPKQQQPTVGDDIYYDEFGWVKMQQMPDPASPGPRIEKDRVITYVAKINSYLKTDPYTDPDFSMQQMSRSLAIPVHHLEYLFRYYNKNTFVEFRNILRVRYTLLCLEQDLWKTYTLEAIGEKAGFASRTTLFRVFKQVTGKSPKAYLDAMQQSHKDLIK